MQTMAQFFDWAPAIVWGNKKTKEILFSHWLISLSELAIGCNISSKLICLPALLNDFSGVEYFAAHTINFEQSSGLFLLS